MSETDGPNRVVTAFLRHRGDVLVLRRSDAVGTYSGRWGGVSGYVEGDPDEQIRIEIREETGLDPDDAATLVRSGRPIEFRDPELDREWVVHPYLFDCATRDVRLSAEHDDYAWVSPTAIATDERRVRPPDDVPAERPPDDAGEALDTVPKLWAAYERVAPSVRSIAADDERGAAWLSVRALEVLRDRAGLLVRERAAETAEPDRNAEWDELAGLARRLLEARPSMAVLRNRVNGAMAGADEGSGVRGAETVLHSAVAAIERAVEADEATAERAGEFASDRILTLSRSGTVLEALRAGEPDRVFVAESAPGREGVGVAETLAEDGPVTLHTDAATAHLLAAEEIDVVLVGADTVLPDGRVVNKTGTRAAAIAADSEEIPVYAVAASDKVSTREEVNLESGERSAIYDGDAPLDVANPTFDVTPADCVTGVVTERGVLDPDGVADVAAALRAVETWADGG